MSPFSNTSVSKLIVTVKTGAESRYMPVAAACLAIVLMLPAINAGFIQDDLFHRIRLVEPSQLPEELKSTGLIAPDSGTLPAAMRDMHSFARTQRGADNLKESGLTPWWTPAEWRFANWRPIDSLTHWLDYRLFPDSPAPMHLHSIVWFAAVVLLLSILYRKFTTPAWIAALAALLYIVDDNNYFPAMWIANRNLILALFFSILTLLGHHKWRQDNSPAAGAAAAVTLLLSLLSTEAGIATFAYLLAYALTLDRGSRTQRAFSLAPSLILIVTWRVIYNSLGYGAMASGFVIDPGREPMRYARAVLERAPILLVGQLGPTPAEMLCFFSDYVARWYFLAALAFMALFIIVLIPLLRKNRIALFWFVGMLLCVPPICATVPMNRNLLFVAIGAFGLIAQFLGGFLTKASWLPKSRYWRLAAWILCITLVTVHLGVAAVGRIRSPGMTSRVFETFNSTIEVDPSIDLTGKTLVVVNAPYPFLFVGLPFFAAFANEPMPQQTRLLAPGFKPLEITRTGEKTLLLKAKTGNVLSTDTTRKELKPNFAYFYYHFNRLFRPVDMPFKVGEKTELSDMSIEIINVDHNGQPTEVSFEFSASLDDPALCWLQWHWQKRGTGYYSTFEIPPIGQTTTTQGPFDNIE